MYIIEKPFRNNRECYEYFKYYDILHQAMASLSVKEMKHFEFMSCVKCFTDIPLSQYCGNDLSDLMHDFEYESDDYIDYESGRMRVRISAETLCKILLYAETYLYIENHFEQNGLAEADRMLLMAHITIERQSLVQEEYMDFDRNLLYFIENIAQHNEQLDKYLAEQYGNSPESSSDILIAPSELDSLKQELAEKTKEIERLNKQLKEALNEVETAEANGKCVTKRYDKIVSMKILAELFRRADVDIYQNQSAFAYIVSRITGYSHGSIKNKISEDFNLPDQCDDADDFNRIMSEKLKSHFHLR